MATKTYVTLDILDSDAPIYQVIGEGKRSQLKKKPQVRPYLQITYQDKDGISRTIRYKSNSNYTFLQDQIEKEKLDANAKFTQGERDETYFRYGILVTNKVSLQNYIEAYPGIEGFEGSCDEVPRPWYKLLDKAAENKIKNSDMRLRVKAASKVMDLELDAAQALLIRLNGSFFDTPTDVEECQNLLMNFIDDAEEEGLKAVLKEEKDATIDESTTVLIGKLVNAKHLSFNDGDGSISKKGKDDKLILLKEYSVETPLDERKRLFSDFLNSEGGKDLKKDLEKDLAAIEKKAEKAKT